MVWTDLSENQIEELFVKNFIFNERVERSLYELHSLNKRRKFFEKIYDNSILDQKNIIILGDEFKSKFQSAMLIKLLIAQKINEKCYLMSAMTELDRLYLSLNDGVDRFLQCYFGAVLVCGENLALVHGEKANAHRPFLLLAKNKKLRSAPTS